ncbi:MAG TPA: PLP-dependent aminotransferase family protein [Actinoplanes sp.]|nr:PLP-dependent aminotransferase family protein [Actinoplanes sp.]
MSTSVRGGQLARILGRWHSLPGRHRRPDYAALAAAIRGLLSDGRLPLGVRLPAERELAESLEVSRTTVTAAYRALRESGHLTSRRGAGSWTTLPAGHRVASSGLWTPDDDLDMIDLGVAASAAPIELVPAARAAADDLPRYLGSAGYHPTGLPDLRDAVAAGYAARGVPTSAEQILITSGTQQALDLVLRLSVPSGAQVLVESPTYPNALAALAARRARITTHGLDATAGWDGELLLGALRQVRPRLAYVIPEFQNPTGHLMTAALRERLVAAAHATGTELVVDESFVDLPLDGAELTRGGKPQKRKDEMPPPVAVFDRHSRVVSIGGMSKAYWGGLRIGWVRAAAPLVQRLAALRVGVDMASPVLEQIVAVHLLADAETIVAERRAQLAFRRDTLVTALGELLPEWRVVTPGGGVTLWAELDGPISSALARAAEDVGVRLAPGPRFGLDGTLERFIRLPFTLSPEDLTEAVRRIAAVRHDLDHVSRPAWRTPAVIA